MKTILAALTLTLALTSFGQVIVWKQTGTSTETGQGMAIRSSFTGYMVFDADGEQFVFLDVYSSKKQFKINYQDGLYASTVATKAGKELCVIAAFEDSSAFHLEGLITPGLDIGDQKTWKLARSLKGTGFSLQQSDTPRHGDSTGSFTLDLKTTKAHNVGGFDLEECLTALKAPLLAKGYTETE